jgi:hypothetical protein
MEDYLLMCSFQLSELLPLTNLRGVNCSTEPTYELEGEDDGNIIPNSLFTNHPTHRRHIIWATDSLLTIQPTPWSWVILQMLIVAHLFKKFQEVYRIRRFVAVFSKSRHQSLSRVRGVQSPLSYPNTLRTILILSYPLRVDLPCCILSAFPTKTLNALFFGPMRAICSDNRFLLDLVIPIIFVED